MYLRLEEYNYCNSFIHNDLAVLIMLEYLIQVQTIDGKFSMAQVFRFVLSWWVTACYHRLVRHVK